MAISWVLFDAVGTLLQVHPSVAEIYQSAAERFGSRRTRREIRDRFPTALGRHFQGGETNEDLEWQRWHQIVSDVLDDLPPAHRERAFQWLWHHFSTSEAWRLFKDVPRTWDELRGRGFRLGIASNFDRRLHRVCAGLPPLHLADALFVSSELGFSKPHLGFFRAIERALGVPGDRILLVGDSWSNDVEGAVAAGWHAAYLHRESPDPGPDSSSDRNWESVPRIASLTGLSAVLSAGLA